MIAVTGANGLVGSRAVEQLAAAGERVLALGRGPRRDVLPDHPRVEYRELDLLESSALERALIEHRPSAVLHCAAMTDVDACESRPVEAWALNTEAVAQAARACRTLGARLVALSTDYVFDGRGGPYGEDEHPHPAGVYARTKAAGEEAALVLAPGAAVCRVAVVFSGRHGAKRTFAVGVLEALRKGQPVKAFEDQVVSPTLADHAARLVLGVLRAGAAGIFHCSGAEAVTRVEFCRRLARKVGADEALVLPVLLAELKLPAPRPLRCALKVDKVSALLGPGARMELDEALERFLREQAS